MALRIEKYVKISCTRVMFLFFFHYSQGLLGPVSSGRNEKIKLRNYISYTINELRVSRRRRDFIIIIIINVYTENITQMTFWKENIMFDYLYSRQIAKIRFWGTRKKMAIRFSNALKYVTLSHGLFVRRHFLTD